jgi:hypothetical protein
MSSDTVLRAFCQGLLVGKHQADRLSVGAESRPGCPYSARRN